MKHKKANTWAIMQVERGLNEGVKSGPSKGGRGHKQKNPDGFRSLSYPAQNPKKRRRIRPITTGPVVLAVLKKKGLGKNNHREGPRRTAIPVLVTSKVNPWKGLKGA